MLAQYLRSKRGLLVIICPSLFALSFLYYTFQKQSINSKQPAFIVPQISSSYPSPSTSSVSSFWPQFYAALLAATPRCSLPHTHIEAYISAFMPGDGPIRANLIHLDDEDVAELTAAHSWFVSEITNSSFPIPAFTPGSSGVVTTAGGEFLPEVLVAIRMLRRTGSTLPVDVFIADEEEVEQVICDTVLRDLGATCHVLSRLIDAEGLPQRQKITRYQLKAFALLFSQYDNLFWMDADQMPLIDPRELMEAEPFKSRGLVTWPDYWFPTSSPLFYKIAGVPDDRVPKMGDRAASETAQLLISKSLQLHTLELLAYYNFHGPSHYYKLLSQGAIGEGDKETFLAAAQALNTPFWAVETMIDTIGYHTQGRFIAKGMLQANPTMDYQRTQNGGVGEVKPAFLHSEQHKPNAGRFSKKWRETVNERMFGPPGPMVEKFGYDMEKVWWELVTWTACDLDGYVFRDWIDNPKWVDEGDVCEQARSIQRELFGEELPDETEVGSTA